MSSSSTQQSQGPPKATISREEWDKKLENVKINKDDLNKLVMNYLVIEGYKSAAEKFSQETGIAPNVAMDSIQGRMDIRKAIQEGNIEEAIERVNELNPEILETNPHLHFHLQQQRLIELIRQNEIPTALDFAAEELAPRGLENPEFLAELEKTMALLAFDEASLPNSPVAYLLDHHQRHKTAQEVNSAILVSQSQEKEAKLPTLLRMLVWSQGELGNKVYAPKIVDLGSGVVVTDEPMNI